MLLFSKVKSFTALLDHTVSNVFFQNLLSPVILHWSPTQPHILLLDHELVFLQENLPTRKRPHQSSEPLLSLKWFSVETAASCNKIVVEGKGGTKAVGRETDNNIIIFLLSASPSRTEAGRDGTSFSWLEREKRSDSRRWGCISGRRWIRPMRGPVESVVGAEGEPCQQKASSVMWGTV